MNAICGLLTHPSRSARAHTHLACIANATDEPPVATAACSTHYWRLPSNEIRIIAHAT